MTRSAWSSAGLAFPILWIAPGCDAQMEPGYQGDVLVSLTGETSADEPLPAGLRFEVHWTNFVAGESCPGFGDGDPFVAPPFIASAGIEIETVAEDGEELPNPFAMARS